ncbi:MAG: hypothetical protein H0V73_13020 [Chloroflexi bacterium]|nr:hypothetical protein [Chloroflexota bacterium]
MIAIAIGAVVIGIGGKILLGLAAGAVVGGTLGALFGGPFARLPADQRSQLDARFTAAIGSRVDGLSDTDKQRRVLTLVKTGLPRLPDSVLIERVQLFTTALERTDVATCAAVARGSLQGKVDEAAAEKTIGTLETTAFGRWVEINVEAMEAENSGAPPPRTVAQAASDTMYRQILGQLSTDDTTTIAAVAKGGSATDEDACAAMRHLYAPGKSLDPVDLAAFALADVTT